MKTRFVFLALSLLGVSTAQEQAEPVVTLDGEEFYDWSSYANSQAFRDHGMRCGTSAVPHEITHGGQFRPTNECSSSNTTLNPAYEPGNGIVYEIPVVFHVISNTNGTGNMGSQRVRDQIEILNEDFRALPGTPGAGGTDTRIQFYLATEDPAGNPTNGINRVTNNNWFNDSGNYYAALAWDTNRYLNIYTTTASGALGYANVPQSGSLPGSTGDGITLLYSAVGRNAPIGPPYNQGRTGTHEVGHYLGLYHTFSGGCGSVFCLNSGDLICDTNHEASPVFGCPVSRVSCNTPDPYRNYMDYTDDTCMTNFTPQQALRMRCTISEWRPNLHRPQCQSMATVSTRNSGSNPNVHTSTAPVLGGSWDYTITTTPFDFAQIVGYSGQGSLVLSGGQTVLVDLGSPKLFQFPAAGGPNVSSSVEIPLDLAFCNVPFTTQAVLFGGTTPFALTNAQDHVLGGF